MEYKHFIELVGRCQTSHVKPLLLANSCAPDHIPKSFAKLIPEIIYYLEKNFAELSKGKPFLAVSGLQVSYITIESDMPVEKKRIFKEENIKSHFCCTLFYLPVTENDLAELKDWTDSETLTIDFTSGLVMDNEHYFYKLFNSGNKGRIYGELNHQRLSSAWNSISSSF